MNTLGSAGENLIKDFEEFRSKAYQDQGGVWTCGWGHTGSDVTESTTCTPEQAEEWFRHDTQAAVRGVDASLTTNVNQNQFDALTSFTFNVGVGAEAHSTLARLVNARDFTNAAAEFQRWDHVNGVQNAGLLRRRLAERALFLT